MILLKDLFKQLATGEFANIALSRDSEGLIAEEEYDTVITHINLAVVEIYKRFNFLENEIVIHIDKDVDRYYLRADKVTAGVPDANQYIEQPDDIEGLMNIIEVKAIFDADGDPVILNDRNATPVVRQLAPDVLKITGLTENQVYNIVYQASPSKIVMDDDFDLSTQVVYIPDTIIEAILYYVAMRVYKPTGSNDSTVNADKSATYQQQYELSCTKLEMYGLDIQDTDTNDTFENEGWA